MSLTKVGLNLTGIENIEPINITVQTNATAILNSLPQNAHTLTNGWFSYIVLWALFILLYWVLTDFSPFGTFKYSRLRGMGIAFGIVAILGIVLIQIGYLLMLRAVIQMILLFILSLILIIIMENK